MGVTKFFDDRIGIVIPIKGGAGVRIWNKIELNKAVVFRFAKLAPGGYLDDLAHPLDAQNSISTPAWGATVRPPLLSATAFQTGSRHT